MEPADKSTVKLYTVHTKMVKSQDFAELIECFVFKISEENVRATVL